MTKQSSSSKAKDHPKPKWLDEPQQHDYPAAASYLSLIAGPKAVSRAVKALEQADAVNGLEPAGPS